MRIPRLHVLVAFGVLAALPGGCRSRPAEKKGPLFVAFIVDTSESASDYQSKMAAYAKTALEEYGRQGPINAVVINLNQDPKVVYQDKEPVRDDDAEKIVRLIGKADLNATGTDIVTAFEMALNYHSYERIKPAGFKILCFTDGHVDPPKGRTVRKWSELDWARFEAAGASIGVYFLDNAKHGAVRAEVEAALRPVKSVVIKESPAAVADLDQDAVELPK